MSYRQAGTRVQERNSALTILTRSGMVAALLTAAACGSDREDAVSIGSDSQVQATVVQADAPVTTTTVALPSTGSALVSTSTDSSTGTPSSVTFGDAERVFRLGDYKGAADMFASYTTRMPANPWGHYMMGISAWRAGDHGRAESALRRAVEIDGKNVKSVVNLARVLLEERKASDALDFALEAVRLAPENGEAWRVLGNAHSELRMSDAAADAYKKAIAIDPEDAQTMNNLGLLRIQQGEYMAALYPLARATELKPGVASFQNNLGVALERAGYLMFAADAYRAALTADEKYEKARVSLERVEPLAANAEIIPLDLPALAADFTEEVMRWQSEGKPGSERDQLPGGCCG